MIAHLLFLRSWNRDDVVSLRQQPRERDLSRCCTMLCPDLLQAVDELKDIWKVGCAVPRDYPPEVIRREIIGAFLRVDTPIS